MNAVSRSARPDPASRAVPVSGVDLYAGAGGSSSGLRRAGVHVTLALNHSPTAIASHTANHPHTVHRCVDLSQTDPGAYHRTDLLWASPECTFFSSAVQPKVAGRHGEFDPEVALRSRATGFDMLRWLDRWQHPVAIVENVLRWRSWPLFPTLLDGLTRLGYDHEVVYRNAALDGAGSWRDRMFLVAWRRGLPRPDLTVRAPARCGACGPVEGVAHQTRSFADRAERVAGEVASGRRRQPLFAHGRYGHDWHLRCPGCGERATADVTPAAALLEAGVESRPVHGRRTPLRPATLARLRRGLARHGRPTPDEPDLGRRRRQLIVLNYAPHGRVWPAAAEPLNTITGVDSHAVLEVDRLRPGPVAPADVERLLRTATYRMLTVTELKRAMGFDDDYQLTGTDREQRIQVGLAVAVPTAEALGRAVLPTVRQAAAA